MNPSLKEFAKDNPKVPLKEAKFKNNLVNIRDTYWSHIDPNWTLQSISKLKKSQMLDEIMNTSSLINATVFPFASPFPKLCFEFGRYCNYKESVPCDTKDDIIMDFSPKDIEYVFKWNNEELIYTKQYSLDYY